MATQSASVVQSSAEVEFERLNLAYEFDPQYDLSKIRGRVQVREDGHYSPKDAVVRYAVQMKHSMFPPIVVTSDGLIVDGNTRVDACLSRELKFFPAFVLDVAGSANTTSDKQKRELKALGATLNAQNGTPLTAQERRVRLADLIALGWNAENAGRALGVTQQTVGAVKREIEAQARLVKVGLNNGKVATGASLRALGAKSVLDLNDEPYKELATLAVDAGLNATEIASLGKEAKQTGSDAEALERIQRARAEQAERIKQKQLTGAGKPSPAGQFRQYLGGVLRWEGEPKAVVETNPDVVGKHVDAIGRAIALLTQVLEVQPR